MRTRGSTDPLYAVIAYPAAHKQVAIEAAQFQAREERLLGRAA